MDKNNIKKFIIDYKKKSIHILIKKNKLSRNLKLTFDRKNLCGLVSIPVNTPFKSGLEFANENKDWLYNEARKLSPLISIEQNSFIMVMGKKKKIIFRNNLESSVMMFNDQIIINAINNKHKKIFKNWLWNFS